jgi:hypothetical protein
MKRALVLIAAAVLVIAAVLLWGGHHDDAPAADRAAPGGHPRSESRGALPELPSSGPPELVAARAERSATVDALKVSGKTTASWANDGNLLLEQLAHDSHAVAWTQHGCFAAGCGGTLMYASEDALTAGRAIAQAFDGYRAWRGSKHWTSPERWLDGRVSITLVLGPPS